MQKISSYLYPNVIRVVTNMAIFPVRWNIVYQNRIKIYQNIDNVLTIDVKNSEQKRIDISDMDLKMCITDVLGKELLTSDLVPSTTTGLATVTISEDDLLNLTPQFLTFSIYKVNDDLSKTILYADTQFGIKGNMELVGSALGVNTPERSINRFLPLTNDIPNPPVTTWFSDAVEIRKPNFLTDASTDSIELVFNNNGLDGTIIVQTTKDDVITSTTNWSDIDDFEIASNTSSVTKNYDDSVYSRDLSWLRVKYTKKYLPADFSITQSTTGAYLVRNIKKGSGYSNGETIVFLGRELGGNTPANNLTITVDSVEANGAIGSFSVSGLSPNGTRNFTLSSDKYTGNLDKVVVRL